MRVVVLACLSFWDLNWLLVALFAVVDRAFHHLLQARGRCEWPTEKTQHLSVVWMIALVWMYIWHGLVRRKSRPWCLRWRSSGG